MSFVALAFLVTGLAWIGRCISVLLGFEVWSMVNQLPDHAKQKELLRCRLYYHAKIPDSALIIAEAGSMDTA